MYLAVAAVFGCTGVAFGAFGAHALKGLLTPEYLAVFETAVRYQMYHTLALTAVVLLSHHVPVKEVRSAAIAFITGIILFSGSLYLLTFTGLSWFGAVTPFGGVSFLAGWYFLFRAALQIKKEN